VGRFRIRSCTPGFGVLAYYGRWRRKRLSGRRRRGKRGLLAVVQAEGLRRGVWDHAAFPKGKAMGEGGCGGIINRPTLPNPAERVFAEVRRWVEGRRYESIEAKKAAVEEVPRRLEAEGEVSSLVGWRYIRQAWNALPS
jgi:hypothetical protein